MRVSSITENTLTNEIVDSVLFQGLEATHKNADCIVVLGSLKATQYRVPAAVKAYMAGLSDKLLFCGGTIRETMGSRKTEAELMREKAIELGVSVSNIYLENSSRNTKENLLLSLNELQQHFGLNNIKSILLVTTTYHMRRSLALAKHLYPEHIAVYPYPVDDTNTRRENWMLTEAGEKRAKAEVMNIVNCVHNGVFPDFELSLL